MTVAKLNHSYTGDAKDNGDGTHGFKCVNGCNEYGKAEAHSFTESDVILPTCIKEGSKTLTCTVCGYTEKAITPKDTATGHKITPVKATKAGCTTDGNVMYYHCELCGRNFGDAALTQELESVVIPASGHTKETVKGMPATCTENGLTDGVKCSVCGETLTAQEIIPATGHTYGEWIKNNDGTHTKYCSVCGEDTDGHSVTESCTYTSEVTTAAACTTDGERTYTCTVCGYSYTEIIPAAGHAMTETEKKDATCTEDGNIAYFTCGSCHKIFADKDGTKEITADETVIKASGHAYGEWKSNGNKTHTRVCGNDATHVETEDCKFVMAAYTAPTCLKGAYITYECEDCGFTFDK